MIPASRRCGGEERIAILPGHRPDLLQAIGLGERLRALAPLATGAEGRVRVEVAVVHGVAEDRRERGLDQPHRVLGIPNLRWRRTRLTGLSLDEPLLSGETLRTFGAEQRLHVAPVEITESHGAKRRDDVGLEELRVAAARLGLELLHTGLEPSRGV